MPVGRQRPVRYGRASKTRLKGVSVARRNRAKPPPFITTSRNFASPALAPRAGPLRASDTGTQSGVILHLAARTLIAEPLAYVSLRGVGAKRQFSGRESAFCEFFIESESVSNQYQRCAHCGAEISNCFAEKFIEFRFIDWHAAAPLGVRNEPLRPGRWARTDITAGGYCESPTFESPSARRCIRFARTHCSSRWRVACTASRLQLLLAYGRSDFELASDLLARKQIDPTPMITDRIGFEALRTRFTQCKVLLAPRG